MRVKRGFVARRRRKKILKANKGFRGSSRRLFKAAAKVMFVRSLVHAYYDRRKKKSNFRRLWTQRINAATRAEGVTYSRFIAGLKKIDVQLNRKMLAEIAVTDKETFKELVSKVKSA